MKHFYWETQKEWLIKTPGVVFAISLAIKVYTNEGDAVLIQQPVYYPFTETIELNNRKLVINTLKESEGSYSIDFDLFEQQIISENVKLFLLCSPHNPVGRVWTVQELTLLGNICLKHNVIVVSDEIHCDFTYPGFQHTVFANINEDFAQNSIICTAPSKTFNLAGLQISNIFIKNASLRKKLQLEMAKSGYSQLNTVGLAACQAAYLYGENWLTELKAYLHANLQYIREYIDVNLPQIKLIEPQGTYLIWLDFRGLNLTQKELADLILNRAKLWLDSGQMFGESGAGFERINIACPREILIQAMEQLNTAVKSLNS